MKESLDDMHIMERAQDTGTNKAWRPPLKDVNAPTVL